MKWTTKKPTKEGWYWLKTYEEWKFIKLIDRLFYWNDTMIKWNVKEWAGPIQEPLEGDGGGD